MAVQSEAGASVFDTVKLVFASLFVVAGVAAFYYFSAYSLLYRVLGLLAIVAAAAGIVFTTRLGRGFWVFLKDARIEVRKVVWPTRQETTQTTVLVIVMVFLVGLILWLLDAILLWAVKLLTGEGG